jgi:hypothetical protein
MGLTVFERLRRRIGTLLLANRSFHLFRSLGVHLTPVHYYSPIPDLRDLLARPHIWDRPSTLPGVNMNAEGQLRLMQEVLAAYLHECDFPRQPGDDPAEFYTQNGYFGYVSAFAMHGMIRHHRPQRIIEVGAGHSTRVIARAVAMNAADGTRADLVVVDPYLDPASLGWLQGMAEVVSCRVEDVGLERFASLQRGDLLSIDTSHAVRIGGDVVFMYLELLPRLAPGVLVQIHDIFLPFNYPEEWLRHRRFWNEQYLLHAFLIHNNAYEVLWAQKYAESVFLDAYARTFGRRIDHTENFDSYSLWLRRIRE